MSRYKAILFDLDGTLVDSVPVILEAASRVLSEMGLPYDEAVVRKAIGVPLRTQALQWAGSRAEEFRERYHAIYRPLQDAQARLFPGTREMLETVRSAGHLTAVVTSKITWGTQRALERTGISDLFDTVITADDVVHHKPHPDPILKALESLGITSQQALYVGDSIFDAEAALAAKVDMAGVSWGALSREDLLPVCPMGVFDSWEELLDRLHQQAP